jgi:hypothetical protein
MARAGHAPRDSTPRADTLLSIIFPALALGLALARFHAFRPFLDEPHAFRQAWTSGYTQQFYAVEMNIFRPSILAMGDYRHILIEFPLPEWIAAAIYHATGPTLLVDRAVSIGFFLASAYFLFRAIALVRDTRMAWLVTLLYLAAPLGIYYSRAVHIDSAALAFGHALLFYFLRYGETGRGSDLTRAFLASALGLLVKAPYVFFLVAPALYVQVSRGHRRRALVSTAAFTVALGIGIAWYLYAQAVNRAAPDLGFVRGYQSAADRLDFYLGDAARRTNPREWMSIASRAGREIAVHAWWILIPIALVSRRHVRELWDFAAVWTLGSLAFVGLFFAASSMHHYYQLPLIAPFAIWLAIPLYRGLCARGRLAPVLQVLAMSLVAAYCASGVWFAFRHYYWVDELGVRVGRYVAARTNDRDLVIMAFNDAQFLDPRYLYYAGRRGWTVHGPWLEPRAIEGLRAHGATTVVTSDRWAPPPRTVRYLEGQELTGVLTLTGMRVFVHRIRHGP